MTYASSNAWRRCPGIGRGEPMSHFHTRGADRAVNATSLVPKTHAGGEKHSPARGSAESASSAAYPSHNARVAPVCYLEKELLNGRIWPVFQGGAEVPR